MECENNAASLPRGRRRSLASPSYERVGARELSLNRLSVYWGALRHNLIENCCIRILRAAEA